MTNKHLKPLMTFVLLLSTAMILFPEISLAGTGGEELQTLYDKTVAIAQGYGGKSIAVIAFILGLVGAVRKYHGLRLIIRSWSSSRIRANYGH